MFLRMAAIFTHKWTSQYPTENALKVAKSEWAEALHDLTGEQIQRGLKACRQELQWPPSIAEFREKAIGIPTHAENAAMYRTHSTLALPRPKADYSKARPFLQTMKAAVNTSTIAIDPLEPQPEVGDQTPAAEDCEPSGVSFTDDSAG